MALRMATTKESKAQARRHKAAAVRLVRMSIFQTAMADNLSILKPHFRAWHQRVVRVRNLLTSHRFRNRQKLIWLKGWRWRTRRLAEYRKAFELRKAKKRIVHLESQIERLNNAKDDLYAELAAMRYTRREKDDDEAEEPGEINANGPNEKRSG